MIPAPPSSAAFHQRIMLAREPRNKARLARAVSACQDRAECKTPIRAIRARTWVLSGCRRAADLWSTRQPDRNGRFVPGMKFAACSFSRANHESALSQCPPHSQCAYTSRITSTQRRSPHRRLLNPNPKARLQEQISQGRPIRASRAHHTSSLAPVRDICQRVAGECCLPVWRNGRRTGLKILGP